MPTLPANFCPRLAPFDPTDWNATDNAFKHAPALALSQNWLEKPEPNFQPATVRAGWEPEALWVYADLADLDIYNSATQLNENTWRTGDVFEMFLRPLPTEPWLELHVTPENQQLQLRWPDNEDVFTVYQREGLTPFYLEDSRLISYTLVEPDQNRWRVLARVPQAVINGEPEIHDGDEWLFSFCRYDATRGVAEPVLSSSSPLTVAKFDTQNEWRKMKFVD